MHFRRRRSPAGYAAAVLVASVAVTVAALAVPTQAQDRSRMIRALRHGGDFRLRVQAAFVLSNCDDPKMRPHLEHALAEDDNPAVRAAAAAGLGRLGSERALPALRRAQRDSSASVRKQVARSIRALTNGDDDERPAPAEKQARDSKPTAHASRRFGPKFSVAPREGAIPWPRVRYVVRVGEMSNGSGFAGEELGEQMKALVLRRLRLLRGVAVFDADAELGQRARQEIDRRKLPELRLEGNVVEVRPRPRGPKLAVRCEVSLVLLEDPERNMRGMLSGAATGSKPRRRDRSAQALELAQDALEGAVRSAMANAPQALAQAARH